MKTQWRSCCVVTFSWMGQTSLFIFSTSQCPYEREPKKWIISASLGPPGKSLSRQSLCGWGLRLSGRGNHSIEYSWWSPELLLLLLLLLFYALGFEIPSAETLIYIYENILTLDSYHSLPPAPKSGEKITNEYQPLSGKEDGTLPRQVQPVYVLLILKYICGECKFKD